MKIFLRNEWKKLFGKDHMPLVKYKGKSPLVKYKRKFTLVK